MAIAIPIAAAAVTAGATIYSASQESDAIQGSSQAQTAGNADALALNRSQADRTDAEYAPWRTVGAGALQMLARTEGIQVPADTFSYYHLPIGGGNGAPGAPGTPGATATTPAGPQPDWDAYLQANPDVMAWAQSGHGDPNTPIDQQTLEQRAAYQFHNTGQAEGRALPMTAAAPPAASPAATAPGPQAVDINGKPIVNTPGKPTGTTPTPVGAPAGSDPRYGDFFASPDYQFRLDEGSRAITGNKAAKGLLDSGSLGTGLIKFGQNTASGEFGSWYNRIAALAGVGQTAVAGSAAAGAQATAAQTGIIQQQGQNLASSIAATGGVNAGLINNLGNTAAGLIRNYPTTPSSATDPNIDAAAINAGAVDFGRATSGGGLFGPPI